LTLFFVAALIAAAAAVVEIALPGRTVYHAGWYNVLVVAIVIVTFGAGHRVSSRAPSAGARRAIFTVVAGAALAGFATVASGLFAPDNQTFIGAPGERIAVGALGILAFPLASARTASSGSVTLERPRRAPVEIGERRRDAGNFILRTTARSVVYVEARDLRGNRLTITQPAGSEFLSPVLLMEHRQTIAGMDLPFDSFAVPAAKRVVKAVMFTPAQAAMLLRAGTQLGEPAVLFAVDDENERPIPHAIALSAGREPVRVGGLWLQAAMESYPAVEVVAAPNILATAAGALLVLSGLIALLSARY
jgi:hypothetical protein